MDPLVFLESETFLYDTMVIEIWLQKPDRSEKLYPLKLRIIEDRGPY